MGKKTEALKKFRAENALKWEHPPITPEQIKDKEKDDELIQIMSKEATLEWLEEERQKTVK